MKSKKICAVLLSFTLVFSLISINTYGINAASEVIRYEAENANLSGTATIKTNASQGTSFSGTGYVEEMNGTSIEQASYATFNVKVEKAGTYQLVIGYATTENTQCAYSVNNSAWSTAALAATGNWSATSEEYVSISLNEGDNTVKVTGATDGKWIILDYIDIDSSAGYITKTASDLVANGNIRMVGRSMTVGTSTTFDWTASGFEFVYEGEGAIKASVTASQGASANSAVIEINVDGAKSRTTVYGTQNVTLASNLSAGKHTIKVNKVNEAGFGLAQLNNIKYPAEGILSKTKVSDLKFEIIGDSVTSGNGVSSNVEDGMGSYATLTAQKFGAEANIISVSGRGLMAGWEQENGWALGTGAEMNKLYNYTSYFRNKTATWDKSSYTPNVIIVNLGNNDLGPATGVTASQYCSEVVKFSNSLRASYPEAHIVWVYGIFVNRNYSDEIRAAVSGLNDSKISFLYMNAYGNGDGGHPNLSQHREIANVLSEYIAEKTGLEYSSDKPDTAVEAIGRHEAEAAYSFTQGSADNAASSVSGSGFSGGQAIGNMNTWPNNGRSYLTSYVNASEAGEYTLTIGYATSNKFLCNIDARVNNGTWISTPAPSTGGTDVVGNISTTITLKKGINSIDITGASNVWYENMEWEWANIDYFELSKKSSTGETTVAIETTSTEITTTQQQTTVEESTTIDDSIPKAIGRHEAEKADYGTNKLQNDAYYSGLSNGAVIGIEPGWATDPIKYISQKVIAQKAGTYNIKVAYATPNKVELMVKANDGQWQLFDQSDSITKVLPASNAWNVAAIATTTITLKEGVNTIYVSGPIIDWNANWNPIYNGSWGNTSPANIDYFELSREALTEYTVQIDDKSAQYEEGETIVLGNAKYGYYDKNGIMYPAVYNYTVTEDNTFTSVNELSVTMATGAGIRIASPTGLRFQATVSSDNMKAVQNQGSITEGIIITANDLFTANNSQLTLTSNYTKIDISNSGWYNNNTGKYCASVVNIIESNYIRNFIARAYVKITYVDGKTETIYSGMSDIRSIKQVAVNMIEAGTEYNSLDAATKAIVDAYAAAR